MNRLRRRLAATGIVLGVAATAWLVFHRGRTSNDGHPDAAEASRVSAGSRALPNLPSVPSLPVPAAPAPPIATPEFIASRVEPLMQTWRQAIINKNPEDVETLDRTFETNRGAFIPALMVSAQSDPEERVRSFSTRVLGKLRPPESVDIMRKLLSDRSEYVRFNAAWALGELDDRGSVPHLRALQQRDPSAIVRRSAGESLRKLEGG